MNSSRHSSSRALAIGGVALVMLAILGACAAGANAQEVSDGLGFWWGLWHGIILPVTFIVSLFTDTVSIYDVNNNGNWYDFGFVLGLALFSGPAMALRGRG